MASLRSRSLSSDEVFSRRNETSSRGGRAPIREATLSPTRRVSPSPDPCSYSRLSAMRENTLFKKYLDKNYCQLDKLLRKPPSGSSPEYTKPRTSTIASTPPTPEQTKPRTPTIASTPPTPEMTAMNTTSENLEDFFTFETQSIGEYDDNTEAQTAKGRATVTGRHKAVFTDARAEPSSRFRTYNRHSMDYYLDLFENKSTGSDDTSPKTPTSIPKDNHQNHSRSISSARNANRDVAHDSIKKISESEKLPLEKLKCYGSVDNVHASVNDELKSRAREIQVSRIEEKRRKHKLHIPSFDEYRKGRDISPKTVEHHVSTLNLAFCDDERHTGAAVCRSDSTSSVNSTISLPPRLPRRIPIPKSYSMNASRNRTKDPQGISSVNEIRPIKGAMVQKVTTDSILNKTYADGVDNSPDKNIVALAKGIRMKPSYLPVSEGQDNNVVDWLLDVWENSDLDNSLDDNIIAASCGARGDNPGMDDIASSGTTKDDKILLASDPSEKHRCRRINSSINTENGISGGNIKKMDSGGNFWIVLSQDHQCADEEQSEATNSANCVFHEEIVDPADKSQRATDSFSETADYSALKNTRTGVNDSLAHDANAEANNEHAFDVCPEQKPPLPSHLPMTLMEKMKRMTESIENKTVLRSTSDVSDLAVGGGRKRKERKDRQYKSDPFSETEKLAHGSDYYDGTQDSFLKGSNSGWTSTVSAATSVISLDEIAASDYDGDEDTFSLRNHMVSACSSDSGVIGQTWSCDVFLETDKDNDIERTMKQKTATVNRDLVQPNPQLTSQGDEPIIDAEGTTLAHALETKCSNCGKIIDSSEIREPSAASCNKCKEKKIERKSILREIIDTEYSYGRDLKILQEEFYIPIKHSGLVSTEQLGAIFLNLEELVQVNNQFLSQLNDLVDSTEGVEEDESDVKMGELFLKASSLFLAFENYCVNQNGAASVLEQLEREKELLKVFLQVSQTENSLLRKMHLKSFLVVPIQRITKYPLLLNRLYKMTALNHSDRGAISEALGKIEEILGHINNKTKNFGLSTAKLKRKKSESSRVNASEKFELVKVASEQLGWNRKEMTEVIVGILQYTQPADHSWVSRKGKHLKFTPVHALLVTRGKPALHDSSIIANREFSCHTDVKAAAVVLVREKNGRFQPMREPMFLDRCIVSVEPEYTDVFEIQEWNKEAFLFKADEEKETRDWVRHLKKQTRDLSLWKRRRNGLANIMIQKIT